jgi:hypothetical protein
MAICSCVLPACRCQPADAGGFIYGDLRSELSTHLAPQALFTQSSPVPETAATSFPLSKHTGGGDTAPGSQACIFIYSSCGRWVFPLSCGVFLPPPLLQAFPLLVPGCVPLLPSLSQLVYLQFCEGFPSPLFSTQGALPTLLCVFIVLIAYYSVSLFSPGGGLSRGLC